MTVFREMYQRREFATKRDFKEVQRMLGETIERGYVLEIPVSSDRRTYEDERWFLEKDSGVVFRLVGPGERWVGLWSEVEFPEARTI